MAYYNDPQNQGGEQPRRYSLAGAVIKAVIGLIIIAANIDGVNGSFFFNAIGFIFGLAILAWGVVPYVRQLRADKEAETNQILQTPFPGEQEKDEAEILAEKYYNK